MSTACWEKKSCGYINIDECSEVPFNREGYRASRSRGALASGTKSGQATLAGQPEAMDNRVANVD